MRINGKYKINKFVDKTIEATATCPMLKLIAPMELSSIYDDFFEMYKIIMMTKTDNIPPDRLKTPAVTPLVRIINIDFIAINVNTCFLPIKNKTYILTTLASPRRIPTGAKGRGGSILSKVDSSIITPSISDMNVIL